MNYKRLIKVTVISDLICPFCFIGHYELQEAIAKCADLPVEFEVEYRPYSLLEGMPDDQLNMTKATFMKEKLGQDKYETTCNMMKKWSDAHPGQNYPSFGGNMSQSTRAHRLSLKAFQLGGQRMQQAVLNALYDGYCVGQKDVSDNDVLADIASNTGVMSKDEALKFLQSEELLPEVRKMAADAKSNGVKGVPFTIIDGKWAINGGQSAECYFTIFKKLANAGVDQAPSPFPSSVVEATA